MPRFVILEHDHPVRHWDLLLESGVSLRGWRLAEPPRPGKAIAAEPSSAHRLHYLDYEGPVSGGRGIVRRWCAGSFEIIDESPDKIEIACQTIDGPMPMSIRQLADGGWQLTVEREMRSIAGR